MSPHLFLKKNTEITIFAEFHDDVKLALILERVNEFYNILMPQLVHEQGFPQRFVSLSTTHPTEVNLLKNVDCFVFSSLDFIDDSKGALA